MDAVYTYANDGHACSDPVSIELYSKEKLSADVKAKLSSNITSKLPKPEGNKTLIIGAKVGATIQLLLPYCNRIDVVAQKEYIPILEARFKKNLDIAFVWKKEGLIGQQHIFPKPVEFKCEINIFQISKFHENVKNEVRYNVILLQNILVHPQINILRELMKLQHDILMTMLIPGKISHLGLFQLLSSVQTQILNVFYEQISHQTIQYVQFLTARRQQIDFWEVFVWKRKVVEDSDKQIQSISKIMEEQIKNNEILKEKESDKKGMDIYETKKSVDQYVDFHYSDTQYFGIRNFPLVCAEKCIEISEKHGIEGRALDIGCAVGRSTIELKKKFNQVIGLQYSHAFVDAANEVLKDKYSNLKDSVKFYQGDACKMNKEMGKFDLIFGGNLIDRLYDPEMFINDVISFMSDKSLLVLTSPYTWLSDYTPKEKWIGGTVQDGKQVRTYDRLKELMEKKGLKQAANPENVPFVIKENLWVYQHTSAHMTFWVK